MRIFQKLFSPPKVYGWIYLLAILFFSVLYYFSPKLGIDESLLKCIYFSIVTITTLGYGDLVPTTDFGMLVASVEALIGILLLGLFLNSLSHARGDRIIQNEEERDDERKEELRKSLEAHACLILDVFKTGNPFAWDKHAKHSAPMDELETFLRNTWSEIYNSQNTIGSLHIKGLLETCDQQYETLLSLSPVAANISREYLMEWSSLISNVRNLKQQYHKAVDDLEIGETINWPTTDDIALQVQELIQASLFISKRAKILTE